MKLNTIIKLPDGRIGTICYHNIDGYGGVWGKHFFEMPYGGFGESIPSPEFMLRNKKFEGRVGDVNSECVGENYKILTKTNN